MIRVSIVDVWIRAFEKKSALPWRERERGKNRLGYPAITKRNRYYPDMSWVSVFGNSTKRRGLG